MFVEKKTFLDAVKWQNNNVLKNWTKMLFFSL